MPPRVEPAFFDRTQAINAFGNYTDADVPYFVFDALDEAEALTAVYAATDDAYSGLRREAVEVEERINETSWKIIVRYRLFNATEDGDEPEPTVMFDTSGGTQHVTQSILTRNRYPTTAPDYQGAIGYDGEQVAGVDIVQSVYNFAETHYLPRTTVDDAFRATLAEMTGKVNYDPFRGFAAGEVLFLGATGARRGTGRDDLWEVTYRFAVSKNRTDIDVGGITVAEKLGWDYLWVRYGDAVDEDAKQVVKKPVAVYVEQVYEAAVFSVLGI